MCWHRNSNILFHEDTDYVTEYYDYIAISNTEINTDM